MKYRFSSYLLLSICFFISINSLSQNLKDSIANEQKEAHLIVADTIKINDGPYVFIEDNKLVEKNIINGEVIVKNLPLDAYQTVFETDIATFKTNSKIVVLSDIHGQLDLTIEILKNNKIIDENLKWKFGNGHLVIVGDIFDRGPKVTETLWFIFNLEKQAEKNGGKVHFLLGNHEFMVFHKDLRYINSKYRVASYLLETNYSDLFGTQTVLGRWLRSKPTILKINKDTYVHGGLSKTFLSLGYNLEKINKVMRESINTPTDQLKRSSVYDNYYKSSGPIWYRGYFNDNLPDSEINDILKEINSKHIIVGHCSNKKVVQLYNEKIFGVDSSIKNGIYGEVLLIEGKNYSRGTMDGKELSFKNNLRQGK